MFTVIGFYPDTNQRFAMDFNAETADEAEETAVTGYPGLVVCGVIHGKHNTAETATQINFSLHTPSAFADPIDSPIYHHEDIINFLQRKPDWSKEEIIAELARLRHG